MRRLSFLILLSGISLAVFAQDKKPADLQPIEDGAPVLSAGDAAVEPEVTIRREGARQFREFRVNGRLYKLEVIPDSGPSYVLIDPRGDGQWMRISSHDPLIVPQWVLFRF